MLQEIYEKKGENTAVFVTVLIFIVFHFGMLLLFEIL